MYITPGHSQYYKIRRFEHFNNAMRAVYSINKTGWMKTLVININNYYIMLKTEI